MSSDVTEFVFPPFEGRYSRFLSYPIVDCPSKLPHHPDTRKVYLLFESEQHNPKDGWQWGKGNKSNKDFFSNEPGYSKSFKFKCQNNSCPAVKFVETVIPRNISRIYYIYDHNCDRSSAKSSNPSDKLNGGSSECKRTRRMLESDDDDFEITSWKRMKTKPIQQHPKDPEFESSVKTFASDTREIHSTDEYCTANSNTARLPTVSVQTNKNSLVADKTVESILISPDTIQFETDKSGTGEFLSSERSIGNYGPTRTEQTISLGDIEQEVKKNSEDNVNLKLKIKLRKLELDFLLKQKEKHLASLRVLDEQKAKLARDVSYLDLAVKRSSDEIELLTNQKENLETKLETMENEKQTEVMNNQVKLLESLLNDKENLDSCLSPNDCEVLKRCLGVVSGKKKEEVNRRINLNKKEKASRQLFSDAADTNCNSILNTETPKQPSPIFPLVVDVNSSSSSVNRDMEAEVTGNLVNEVEYEGNLDLEVSPLVSEECVNVSTEEENLNIPDELYSTPTNSQSSNFPVPSTLDCGWVNNAQENEALEELNSILEKIPIDAKGSNAKDKRSFSSLIGGRYKIPDSHWEGVTKVTGNVPHAHSGLAVFEIKLCNKSKLREMEGIDDGRFWKKKVVAKKHFPNCTDHGR